MSKKDKMVSNMSAEELKMKLYAHFHKKGSMDKFRAQLRNELVSELFKVAGPQESKSQTEADDSRLLPLQVSNWLVYDHLQRQGYDYTLSTFATELKLSYPEKFLTIHDILDLLGFKSHTAEYRHFTETYFENHRQAFLYSLISTVMKSFFNYETKSREFMYDKANHKQEVQYSVVNLSKIEKPVFSESNHLRKFDPFSNKEQIAEKDVYYQKQLQAFKQRNEEDVQTLKEKLIKEIDQLHSRERQMHRDLEQTKSELAREKEQVAFEKIKVKEKQAALENNFEKEIEAKLKAAGEYITSQLQSKEKELENWEKTLKVNEQKFLEENSRFDILQKENENLKKNFNDQIEINKNVQSKYSSILDENTNLLKKFESMSDYSVLKSDNISKSSEILSLKHEIKSVQQKTEFEKAQLKEKIRTLQKKLEEKDPITEQELSLMRSNFNDEHMQWVNQREKLEQEVIISKKLYETVIHRLEEQKEDIQDLHRTIHVLHYQLMNKESSSADENAERSKPFSSGMISSEPKRPQRSSSPSHAFRSVSRRPFRSNSDALKFISDAKTRISDLQREADAVKQKYSLIFGSSALADTRSAFQDHMIRTTSSDNSAGRFDPGFASGLCGSVRPRIPGDLGGRKDGGSQLDVRTVRNLAGLESDLLLSNCGLSSNVFSSLSTRPTFPIGTPVSTFSVTASNNAKSSFAGVLLNEDTNATASSKSIHMSNHSIPHSTVSNEIRIVPSVTTSAEITNATYDESLEPNLTINDIQDGESNEKSSGISQTPKTTNIDAEQNGKDVAKLKKSLDSISEVDLESRVPSKNLPSKVVEVMPVIVDLDAAWKQKSVSTANIPMINQGISDSIAVRIHNETVDNEKISFTKNKTSNSLLANVVGKDEGFNAATVGDVSNDSNLAFVDKNAIFPEEKTSDALFQTKKAEQEAMLVECLAAEMHLEPHIKVVEQSDNLVSNTIQKSKFDELDLVQKDCIELEETNANVNIDDAQNVIEVKLSLPSQLNQTEERTEHQIASDKIKDVNLEDEKMSVIKAPQCDVIAIENIASDKKSSYKTSENDDSVSELSEIKLSCGSDQEQKDDSDFW